MPRKKELILIIIFVVWSVAFIYGTSFIANDGTRYFCLFDDAMISMRYANNLGQGFGLVWNQGERIEGITNILMTLYMAASILLFGKLWACLFVQISGVIFVIITAYFTARIGLTICSKSTVENYSGLVPFVFYAAVFCYYPLLYWSLMGMETGLLAALVVSATYIAIHLNGIPRMAWSLPVLLGLAFLTRPDAIIPALLILAYRGAGLLANRKGALIFCSEGAMLLVIVLGTFIFRWFYYAEIFPNTYVLKVSGMPFVFQITNGISFVQAFVIAMCVHVVISLFGLIFNYSRSRLLLLLLFLSSIVYQVCVGGDFWYYWRMMAPYVPLLLLLCIDATAQLLLFIKRLSDAGYWKRSPILRILRAGAAKRPKEIWMVILFMLATLANLSNTDHIPQLLLIQKPYHVDDNKLNVNRAVALKAVCRPQASIAVIWAGVMPYFTDYHAIDMLGKSDKYIARLSPDLNTTIRGGRGFPGHCKYDLTYSIITLNPTYVQWFHWGAQNLSEYRDRNYVLVRYMGVGLWLRRNSAEVYWNRIRPGSNAEKLDKDQASNKGESLL